MAWIGVVTNAGSALLTRWGGENTLTITSAAAGTGTVSETGMLAQTALADQKQTISIIKDSQNSNGRTIILRITSTGLATGYECNQIGIWARINDESPVLFALYQAADGQPVPSAAESPEFVFTFRGDIIMDNTGTITVTVDTTALVTQADLSEVQANAAKHTARFVIGTSAAGWTANDVDYLCDGTADDVEINAAIAALPSTGGEIVILEGAYNITAGIAVNKANTAIRGNGNATILKRMFNSGDAVINTTADMCKLQDIRVDGNKSNYSFALNIGVSVGGNYNVISGVMSNDNAYAGIYIPTGYNNCIITDNVCNNNEYGIAVDSDNNSITGNTCIRGTGQSSDYESTQYTIKVSGDNNLITGNNCMGKSPIDTGTGNVVVSNKSGEVQSFKTLTKSEQFDSVVDTVINLGWKPALVTIDAVIGGSKALAKGTATADWQNGVLTGNDGVSKGFTGVAVALFSTGGSTTNSIMGVVTFTDTGLSISWTKNGTPPSGSDGNRSLIITAFRNID